MAPSATRGLLIVFEGPEGAGKSTQVSLLGEALATRGEHVVSVREPGGTALGDTIRAILLDPASDIVPRSEALLFMASRAHLVERKIRPALDAGAIVLVDRFFLSTYAYQGVGRGLGEDELRTANALATQGLVPDLTLLLMLPVEEGLRRALVRGEQDRMEGAALGFHERVAHAFDTFATPAWQGTHGECGPIVLVDANGDQPTVRARVDATLRARWPERF